MKELNDKLEQIKDLFEANAFDMAVQEVKKLSKFIKKIKKNVKRYKK